MDSKQHLVIEFARKHGVIRPSDLKSLGITPTPLRGLLKAGIIRRIGRGLYTLADFEVTEAHTIVEAVRAQPNSIVCLLSALSFHGISTQQPHLVWLAIPRGSRVTSEKTVPLKVVAISKASYEAGIETHQLEGLEVPIYSIAKTVADCFKFRNKVGLDVALEALREAIQERRCSRSDILKYARINRVDKVMRPYMEALSS